MNNYSPYNPTDRWYKLLELFSSNSSSEYQYLETHNESQEPLS